MLGLDENPKRGHAQEQLALLQGTLDVLILRILVFGPQHGQGIARAIQETSDDVLLVDHGALYPALQRLEEQEMDHGEVGHVANNRKARFYTLTRAGRAQLCSSPAAGDGSPPRWPGSSGRSRRRADAALFPPRTHEDFSAEVQAHLDLETDRLIAEGMSADAARAAALRAFGSVARVKERFYEASRWMLARAAACRTCRYAWRGMRHSPAFVATTV